jgi:hypothetical protein
MRTVEQDVGFGIRQLTDVAVRALSSDFGDATTAVICLDHLTEVLARSAPAGPPPPPGGTAAGDREWTDLRRAPGRCRRRNPQHRRAVRGCSNASCGCWTPARRSIASPADRREIEAEGVRVSERLSAPPEPGPAAKDVMNP